MQLRPDFEFERFSSHRLHSRSRPVGGQLKDSRNVRQLRAPVCNLLIRNRLRIIHATEDISLPQRVIRILHRQRRPPRNLTPSTSLVRNHDITTQWCNRRAIARDVMDNNNEHVSIAIQCEQFDTHRDFGADIKTALHDLRHVNHHGALIHDNQIQIESQVGCWHDNLHRPF
ncbi:hypothetical protein BKP42_68360 [Rhodococcus erythropolis]|nr:hypothetical protein BKP42_68360 [Rhodococcus erythropolis]